MVSPIRLRGGRSETITTLSAGTNPTSIGINRANSPGLLNRATGKALDVEDMRRGSGGADGGAAAAPQPVDRDAWLGTTTGVRAIVPGKCAATVKVAAPRSTTGSTSRSEESPCSAS
jgi:hypothetical protein